LERLKRKHGPTLADVLQKADALRRDLHDVEHGSERLADVESDVARAAAQYLDAAGVLARKRRAAAAVFGPKLEASLTDLAMPKTRCEVRFTDAAGESSWSERGTEQA